MTLDQASSISSIIGTLIGLPVNVWMLYRVCQAVKLMKRHFQSKSPPD